MENHAGIIAIAIIALLYLAVYIAIDVVITWHRCRTNQKAWDEYSKNMSFKQKLDCYFEWCEEQKRENGWNLYYYPKM